MNYIFEIKTKTYICLEKYDCYFGDLCVHFEPLIEWECAYACHNIRNKKMAFTVNIQNIKQAIGIQVTFILKDDLHLSGKKVQKEHFLAKKHCLSGNLCVHFEPLLRCECAYVCPNIRTEKEGIYCK